MRPQSTYAASGQPAGKEKVQIAWVALLAAAIALCTALPAADKNILAPYPQPEEMLEEIRQLAAKHPDRVELIAFGKSFEGRPLYCLRIHRGDGKQRAQALVCGNIHGVECISNRLAVGVANRFLEGDGVTGYITKFLDIIDLYVAPCLNPDGYARTFRNDGKGRVKQLRTNARGVDLNRNFPTPKTDMELRTSLTGSMDPASSSYQGPNSYSEPESRAIRDFAASHRFFADINYHSKARQVTPAKTESDGGTKQLKTMARAYRINQPPDIRYPIIPWPRFPPVYQGNMEDVMYNDFGALSLLIELQERQIYEDQSPKPDRTFWRYNPRDPETVIEDNFKACLGAILTAYRITGGKPIPKGQR